MKTTRLTLIAATFLDASVFVFFSCSPEEIPPIIEEEKEDPYIIGSIGDITKTIATLYAQVFPHGNEVTVSFQYVEINSQSWITYVFDEKIINDNYIMMNLAIDSLKPGTSYKFRALADNAVSEEKSFNTIPIDKAKIFAFPVENVTITTALVKAAVVAGIEDTAKVSFKYSIIGENNWQTISFTQKFFGQDTVKLSLDLIDLKANTKYRLHWEIENDGGISTQEDSIFTNGLSDFDGNLYHADTIGTQTWLRENFRGTHFANGDPIPNITNVEEWCNLSTGAYCWYNNDPEIGKVYGGLYNWWVGADMRELIAEYKTPTSREFGVLGNCLASFTGDAGPALMEAGTLHWKFPAIMGTNSSGFTGLPNGARGATIGYRYFMNITENLVLWENDPEDALSSIAALAEIDYSNCWFQPGRIYKKKMGVGIRLLKK